jgi:hypothetical protein
MCEADEVHDKEERTVINNCYTSIWNKNCLIAHRNKNNILCIWNLKLKSNNPVLL